MTYEMIDYRGGLLKGLLPCIINSVPYFGRLTFDGADLQAASAKGSL